MIDVEFTSPVHLDLERKEHEHPVDEARDRPYALPPPCPHLGRHVVQNRYATAAQATGQPQVEVGEIDQDGQARPACLGSQQQLAEHAADARQLAGNLGDADDRDLVAVRDRLQAGRCHRVATEPEEANPPSLPGQTGHRLHEARAMTIARRLSGGDQNAQGIGVGGDHGNGNISQASTSPPPTMPIIICRKSRTLSLNRRRQSTAKNRLTCRA